MGKRVELCGRPWLTGGVRAGREAEFTDDDRPPHLEPLNLGGPHGRLPKP